MSDKKHIDKYYEEKITELKIGIENILCDYFEIRKEVEKEQAGSYYTTLIAFTNNKKGINIFIRIPKKCRLADHIIVVITKINNELDLTDTIFRNHLFQFDVENEKIFEDIRKIKAKLILNEIFKSK